LQYLGGYSSVCVCRMHMVASYHGNNSRVTMTPGAMVLHTYS